MSKNHKQYFKVWNLAISFEQFMRKDTLNHAYSKGVPAQDVPLAEKIYFK